MSFDTEPTELNVEQAVPCGLILNELVVNALKHGCDGRGRCAVRIAVGRAGELVRVAVSDDGPGLPAGFDVARLRESATLGMRLIAALTRQIGATLQVAPGPGARFVVLVPSTPARGPRRGPRSSLPPPVTTAAG